jgi:hypothetical protein
MGSIRHAAAKEIWKQKKMYLALAKTQCIFALFNTVFSIRLAALNRKGPLLLLLPRLRLFLSLSLYPATKYPSSNFTQSAALSECYFPPTPIASWLATPTATDSRKNKN